MNARRKRNAARAKAALLANGGRIERQGNFIAATGLPWAQGRQAIYDLRDTDDGSDGTPIVTLRGPQGGVYELSHSMQRIRMSALREMRTELRKELNVYLSLRQTLTRIDPGLHLDEWAEVNHKMRNSRATLIALGARIRGEAAEIGTPRREVDSWFAEVPTEVPV